MASVELKLGGPTSPFILFRQLWHPGTPFETTFVIILIALESFPNSARTGAKEEKPVHRQKKVCSSEISTGTESRGRTKEKDISITNHKFG